MADIDFLSSDEDGKRESEKKNRKGMPPDALPMHIPDALPEEPEVKKQDSEKHGFLDGVKDLFDKDKDEDAVEDIFKQKLEKPEPAPKPKKDEKPAGKKEIPKMEVPPLPPPKPPAPPPPPPPKKPEAPAEKKNEDGETLRVSLITTEAGTSLTELTIRDRVKTFIIILALAVALDGLIFGGILYYKSQVIARIQGIEAGVQDLDKEIAEAEKKVIPAQNYQKLTKLSHELLNVHMHWSHVLKLIEERAVTEVQFKNLSGAETGTLISNIIARDYTTLARQLVALREDERVLDAAISSATANLAENAEEGGGSTLRGASAGLTVTINPEIFFTSSN